MLYYLYRCSYSPLIVRDVWTLLLVSQLRITRWTIGYDMNGMATRGI